MTQLDLLFCVLFICFPFFFNNLFICFVWVLIISCNSLLSFSSLSNSFFFLQYNLVCLNILCLYLKVLPHNSQFLFNSISLLFVHICVSFVHISVFFCVHWPTICVHCCLFSSLTTIFFSLFKCFKVSIIIWF